MKADTLNGETLNGETLKKCLDLSDEVIKASLIDMKKVLGDVSEQSIKVASVCSLLDFIVLRQKLNHVQVYDYCLTVAKMEEKHE